VLYNSHLHSYPPYCYHNTLVEEKENEQEMKHALLGAALIFYAMFLTPSYFEPMDLVISTGYFAVLTSALGDLGLVIGILWASTGYVALIFGIVLIGHSISKYLLILRPLHLKTSYIVHHPFIVASVIFMISIVLSAYIFIYGI